MNAHPQFHPNVRWSDANGIGFGPHGHEVMNVAQTCAMLAYVRRCVGSDLLIEERTVVTGSAQFGEEQSFWISLKVRFKGRRHSLKAAHELIYRMAITAREAEYAGASPGAARAPFEGKPAWGCSLLLASLERPRMDALTFLTTNLLARNSEMNIKLENCNLPGPMNWLAFVESTDGMREAMAEDQLQGVPSAHGATAHDAMQNLITAIDDCEIPFDLLMK